MIPRDDIAQRLIDEGHSGEVSKALDELAAAMKELVKPEIIASLGIELASIGAKLSSICMATVLTATEDSVPEQVSLAMGYECRRFNLIVTKNIIDTGRILITKEVARRSQQPPKENNSAGA